MRVKHVRKTRSGKVVKVAAKSGDLKAKKMVTFRTTAPRSAVAGRPKAFKVGELWDDRETAFFQPYADKIAS